jgi:cytidylate kinase
VTLKAIRREVDLEDVPRLVGLARDLSFDLDLDLHPPELRIDGSPPDPGLMSAEVEAAVSRVARHPPLRSLMRDEQRRLGAAGAVMEGRDIGSVVFPDALLRVRLEALPVERASRRASEREGAGTTEVSAAIAARDAQDERNVPPVEGDLHVDSTHLDADRVFELVLAEVRVRLGAP